MLSSSLNKNNSFLPQWLIDEYRSLTDRVSGERALTPLCYDCAHNNIKAALIRFSWIITRAGLRSTGPIAPNWDSALFYRPWCKLTGNLGPEIVLNWALYILRPALIITYVLFLLGRLPHWGRALRSNKH